LAAALMLVGSGLAGAAPGTYNWNHLVNGRATSSPNFTVKDDQLHTSLNVAAYDQCLITPR
jgi:hypothetical protein